MIPSNSDQQKMTQGLQGVNSEVSASKKDICLDNIKIVNRESHPLWLPSMTILLFIGAVIFLIWSSVFEIDQAVRTQGKIIPSARTQIIQVVDGGVLAELRVREGQLVTEGEKLAVLEKERASANYEENLVHIMSLNAELIRAKAESLGNQPFFTDQFNNYPAFVSAQNNYYKQRKQGLEDEIKSVQISLDIAKEELHINQSLFNQGDVSRLEVMRSQRQLAELEGKLTGINNNYFEEAQKDITRLETELAASRYKLEARKSVLSHTDLKSPVAGVVKYLKVNTLGGVLRPGDELMQISPTEDGVVIEARVNPTDIGQLKLGLPVFISLDAFDFSIYGGLNGTLIYLSADTLTEEAGEQTISYYRAHIRVNEDAMALNPKLAKVVLKPGMTVSTSIITGKRSVLQYLLKPIIRGFSGALTER
jgi:adhesin transport system membrane fusion protein